jgi:phytoene synthase
MMADHHHNHNHAQESDDGASLAAEFLPTPRDPRIALTWKAERREAVHCLWALALRLTKLLDDVREPLIGQIKLAWWRDMLVMLAADANALPKGEPLLADFQRHFSGFVGLDGLVDAAEAMLMAEDLQACQSAAQGFGSKLFDLAARSQDEAMTLQNDAGYAWGLLWGAYLHRGTEDGAAMLSAAAQSKAAPRDYGRGGRGLVMLDRLAAQIGQAQGARDLRREGMILLRIGLLGR